MDHIQKDATIQKTILKIVHFCKGGRKMLKQRKVSIEYDAPELESVYFKKIKDNLRKHTFLFIILLLSYIISLYLVIM